MFTTTLHSGVLRYADSPLLRAIMYGRVMVVDEADKAPEHVVAVFRSLAGEGEMTLSDGRRVRRKPSGGEEGGDVYVHPDFRLVLLANRPGYRESCAYLIARLVRLKRHMYCSIPRKSLPTSPGGEFQRTFSDKSRSSFGEDVVGTNGTRGR